MSNLVLVKKELNENKWTFIIGLLILGVTALASPYIYNFVKEAMEATKGVDFPDFIKQQMASIENFESYIWYGWFGKAYHQTAPIFAVLLGMGIVAGEVSKDTISFLLTKPYTRTQIYTSKYLTGAGLLLLMIISSSLIQYLAVLIYGEEFSLSKIILGAINSFGGLMVIFSLATLLSTIFSDRLKAGIFSGLIAATLSIPGFHPDYAKYDFYKYITGADILNGQGFPWASFGIFVVASIGLFFTGLQIFKQKHY